MTEHAQPTPWYRQFWPWFLIALPATSVVAGISTLMIANHEPDGVVVDDYYKQGLAINQAMDRDRKAAALALRAQVDLDPSGILKVAMRGEDIERLAALQVRLLHPTKAGRDQSFIVQRGPRGGFQGKLQVPEPANWHVMIEPMDNSWRLQGRLQWPQAQNVSISAGR